MIQYVGQQFGSLSRPLQQNLQVGPMEKFLNVAKTLGAIQIIIGLIHIGLGGVLAAVWGQAHFISIAVIGGYVFWGSLFGLFFKVFHVEIYYDWDERALHSYSIFLFIEFIVPLKVADGVHSIVFLIWSPFHLQSFGTGSSAVLLLFSFLEFCITISTAHFGCQATCCHSDQQPVVFVPYTVSGGVVAPSDRCPPPLPAYNAEDPFPK
ncbi:membrane-spanning 4-domains subfamily A member 8-like [Anolis sagrei]|uniref:membrane-spanning 4-domains subfamily A member 8-like n=1 Tax=Anolis sagrei TaxID=38937 RepID=UPI0035204956